MTDYTPGDLNVERDANNFAYHRATPDQGQRYEENREDCRVVALRLRQRCPPSRELSIAITKLEEVMFWANAAIARNEKLVCGWCPEPRRPSPDHHPNGQAEHVK